MPLLVEVCSSFLLMIADRALRYFLQSGARPVVDFSTIRWPYVLPRRTGLVYRKAVYLSKPRSNCVSAQLQNRRGNVFGMAGYWRTPLGYCRRTSLLPPCGVGSCFNGPGSAAVCRRAEVGREWGPCYRGDHSTHDCNTIRSSTGLRDNPHREFGSSHDAGRGCYNRWGRDDPLQCLAGVIDYLVDRIFNRMRKKWSRSRVVRRLGELNLLETRCPFMLRLL